MRPANPHLWIKKLSKGTKDKCQVSKVLNWPMGITVSSLYVCYGIGWKKSISCISISKCKKLDFVTVQGHKMFLLYHFSPFSTNIFFLWRFILSFILKSSLLTLRDNKSIHVTFSWIYAFLAFMFTSKLKWQFLWEFYSSDQYESPVQWTLFNSLPRQAAS